MATSWRDLVMSNPAVMHGQACIKGTRIPVSVVLGCLADGMTVDEILADYPSLSPEAILPIPQRRSASSLARSTVDDPRMHLEDLS